MGYKKGQSGNPAGRPPGAVNIVTSDLRQIIKAIVRRELLTLPEQLAALPSEKRLELTLKLLPFVLPKVESVSCSYGEPIDADAIFGFNIGRTVADVPELREAESKFWELYTEQAQSDGGICPTT
ncbi:MAG: DUF5681 domain-containing protein [Bacteroidetes bacterium]|nr:DUF5681 domain-containing protein [Bacteroidota bacterium]